MNKQRKSTLFFLALSFCLGLLLWQQARPVAASGKTGAGQQVGETFRIPAIAGGWYHNLALRSDGTVVAWGDNSDGQTTVPANLSGVTAIAASGRHSLALKSDGTVVAWGRNFSGQATVPANLSGVTAIVAGADYNLALKSDGTLVAWGNNTYGQLNVPANLSGVTAIAAGLLHSLALKSDGTVLAWGNNSSGQATVPAALTTGNNRVVAWGGNVLDSGQATVPDNLSGVAAIAAGWLHSLALKSDGTVVAWGYNSLFQANVPANLSGVTAMAAGRAHILALCVVNNTPPQITASNVTRTAGTPGSNSQIATVSDTQDASTALQVSAAPQSGSGVTVNNISVDANGIVTADVQADCEATDSAFTLTVTDSGGLFATAQLLVTVSANTPPTLTYPSNPGTVYGTAITVTPLTGPSDNSSVNSVQVESVAPAISGGITVDSAGVVTVAGTVPAGNYTVKIRATDDCGAPTEASFSLGIVKATPTITWNNPANITYGTALSDTQLNATANTAGLFNYNPASGTVLNAGTNQILTVNFTPTDTNNFISTSKQVQINVLKAPLTVTVNNAFRNQGAANPPFSGTITGLKNGD
ncbi:MAG: hypothetical protein JNM09_29350, partial [Blastocatellia bacterium]|nr:hypothetical protein [Blastocatellia bacterium]